MNGSGPTGWLFSSNGSGIIESGPTKLLENAHGLKHGFKSYQAYQFCILRKQSKFVLSVQVLDPNHYSGKSSDKAGFRVSNCSIFGMQKKFETLIKVDLSLQ